MPSLIELKVPDIGDLQNVEVIEVLVKPGDRVSLGDDLVIVETDKATMEIPASFEGSISELKLEVGTKVSEGDVIALLEPMNEANHTQPSSTEPPPLASDSPSTIEGDSNSSAQRRVEERDAGADADLSIYNRSTVTTNRTFDPVDRSVQSRVYASPSVRKLARELDIPIHEVKGTGARGRIVAADLHKFVRRSAEGATQATDALSGLLPWPKEDFAKFGPVERMPMTRIKRISSRILHRNWVMIPHVTTHEDADITELEAFRIQINKEGRMGDTKVTMLSLVMKAVVHALKEFPSFNSSLDGEDIVLKRYYHIGFATDTSEGLVVPVVRDADRKGVGEIAREVAALAAKARDGKLVPAEIGGGSFSISSLGGIGGSYFTPIINAPEVAILGIGKAKPRLVPGGSGILCRRILPLSLSWDHRVIDGAQAGRFNVFLAEALADFRRLLL